MTSEQIPTSISTTWTATGEKIDGRGVYENEHGWRVEFRKQRGGPLGIQDARHRVAAHWIVIDPTGRQRADQSRTLKGIQLAAERRAAFDAKGA